MIDRTLLKIASEFRKGMIGKRTSKNWCYAIVAPLAGYLEFCGFRCELVEGNIGDTQHFWIALPDGRILDPTADQFGNRMPSVYLGTKPGNYRLCEGRM